MEGEEFAAGCFLSIKTTLGDEFEGQIISFDRLSNILVLQEGLESGSRRNIRLLKANYIKEFSLLRQDEDPLDVKKCFLDLTSLQAREDSAIRLPVRWDKTVIVVMNEVRVSSPYLPESVSGGTPAANERVRKVLEFERKRMQTRGISQ
ncbi:protein LSM12-like protein [Gossypium australe]|uniref:Protein LSM12-like protein n=1 Tax=Gossypium australe TaxID=47621 RepID=A0A5B6VB06_9ROSI|nr:protein LSM12-like protein [Gossypium australe]